ncbi:MAG: hypothetical protein KIT89_09370 [Microcella sp.]|uniref:nucleotide kinase domain-containing protein n=1 Tax=Microcella sp. TaxID=1913979 RepID=UPI0024CDD91A|nr:nucleotide kinase domain-containing protein [Microcella sp.]UYN82917.1 MAG: hypothetical protein KIT89_09370 [Microcella sp.]
MRNPIPRPGVYELYWKFAAERQKAFEARVSGAPWPWTHDPILQEFKFCNVFRAADRVSQYMIRDVAYKQDDSTPQDRLFQIVAFRTFSNIRTWNSVTTKLERSPRLQDLADGSFERALSETRAENGGLYTGAFILCATDAYGQSLKHLNHVSLFQHMFLMESLADRLLAAASLESIYLMLHEFPLMGDFMSYQTAIDLNYSEPINFSENDFTQPGPGAVRGIKKVFLDLNGLSPREAIMWMVDHQEAEFDRLGYEFNGLWGRRLHAIDAQGLFCETDKYCREAVPELLSARSRIKARFSASTEPLEFFFPPKWGINPHLSKDEHVVDVTRQPQLVSV